MVGRPELEFEVGERLRSVDRRRTPVPLPPPRALDRLVGEAPCFRAAVTRVPAIAASDATVLVTGETGTGKELVARAIHYLSPRAGRPFVAVNCGGLVETLLEDELFGHERGAFTDARRTRAGLLEQADGGTLFLDEVSSATARVQVALLRVLQDRCYRRLGSSVERRIDLRFVAATNQPLQELVAAGAFRADLFYRLDVLQLRLPPLRERGADVLRLARHFAARHGGPGGAVPKLTAEAEAALLAHHWPGNVRELENSLIRGVSFAIDDRIGPTELGLPTAGIATYPTAAAASFRDLKQRVIAAFEHDYLSRLLTEHRGNVTRAARTAGKERRELGKLLKRHHLDPRDFRDTRPPA